MANFIRNLHRHLSYLLKEPTHPIWAIAPILFIFSFWIGIFIVDGTFSTLITGILHPESLLGSEFYVFMLIGLIVILFLFGGAIFLFLRLIQVFAISREVKIIKEGRDKMGKKKTLESGKFAKKMVALYRYSFKRKNRPRRLLTGILNALTVGFLGSILLQLLNFVIYVMVWFYFGPKFDHLLFPALPSIKDILFNFPTLAFVAILSVIFIIPAIPLVEKVMLRFIKENVMFEARGQLAAFKKAVAVATTFFARATTGNAFLAACKAVKGLLRIKFPKTPGFRRSCMICPHIKFCSLFGSKIDNSSRPCYKVHPLRLMFARSKEYSNKLK